MNDKIGKLNAGWLWAFALGAVLLGIAAAYATSSLGSKVSSTAYFLVFAASGFAGAALTRAKLWAGVLAFLLAAVLSGGFYYFLVASSLSEAGSALGGAEAGGMLGAAFGIFAAVITFAVSVTGGLGGVFAGTRAKKLIAAA